MYTENPKIYKKKKKPQKTKTKNPTTTKQSPITW